MSMDMRRVLLIPASARPVDPGLASLSMDAQVWENGYPLVVGKARHGLLQDFWRHYYGESAAMFVAADQLLELHNDIMRSEEHTSELQSQSNIVCRLLLEKKKH